MAYVHYNPAYVADPVLLGAQVVVIAVGANALHQLYEEPQKSELPSQPERQYEPQPRPYVATPQPPAKRVPSVLVGGYGEVLSASTGKTTSYTVNIRERINTNDDYAYDVDWSDGEKTTFVFKNNGKARIITKSSTGKTLDNTAGTYQSNNGEVVVFANTGTRTTIRNWSPKAN